jgi:gliding motility-associated-like protein
MKRCVLPRGIIIIFLLIGFLDSLEISAQLYAPPQLVSPRVDGGQFSIVTDKEGNVYYCGHKEIGQIWVGRIYKNSKIAGVLSPNPVLIAEIPGVAFGMDMDNQGNLFCSNTGGQVFKITCLSSGIYDPNPLLIATININPNIQVLGMAIDKNTGNIYLPETPGKRIFEITNSGGNYNPAYNIIPFDLLPYVYAYPQDLTCDENGNLYGVMWYEGIVFKGTRNSMGGFDFSEITRVGEGSNCIALDNCNNILVGNIGTNSLFEITQNGGIYNPIPSLIPSSQVPTAVAVDKEGNIYSNSYSNEDGDLFLVKRNNPAITINTNNTQICPNSTVTFNSAVSNTAASNFSYQWQVNGVNAGNANALFTSNSLNDGDIITCDIIDLAHCYTVKSNKIKMTVAGATNPAVSIQASANSICAGNPVNFVATASTNANIVSWQWFKNGIPAGNNNPTYSDNVLLNGDNITCQLTTNNSCVTSPVVTSNVINITVKPLLTATINIASSANNICSGSPVTFTANTTNSGTTPVYSWMKNGSTVGGNSAIYIDNSINNSDNIYCIMVGSGCLSSPTVVSNSVRINVSPLLTPTATISTTTGSVCAGSTVTLMATGTSTGNSPLFQWQKNGVPVGASQPSYTDNNPGNNDEITCIIISNEGCVTDPKATSNSIHVQVFPKPVLKLDKSPFLCEGSSRQLDAGNFFSYLWNDGSTERTLKVNTTGKYYVQVKDNNGCIGSDTTKINGMLPLPGNFLSGDTSICAFEELDIRPLGTFRTYTWSTGSTNSTATINHPGKYWLDVSDNNNCAGSDTILVNPKQCLQGFFAPNSFTPNNDGKNDIFRPMLYGDIKRFKLIVFNRWGNIVYQTSDVHKGWDGTFSGRPQDSNLFIWQCSYELQGEQAQFRKGTILLLR